DSLAAALYGEGNYWKLMEISKQAELDSLSPKYLFALGMSYAALSETQRALDCLKRSVVRDSSKLQYRYQYARALSQSGMYREAVEQLSLCIAMDSTYIPARFQLGLTYAAQKKYPEKEHAVFSSLIERNPNDFVSLYYLSEALKRMDLPDSAAPFLRRSLTVNPRYLPALISMSNYLNAKKEYPEALIYYLRADSVRSDNKDLKFQIGECYRRLGDLQNAKYFFKQSLAMDSTNAMVHAQLAYAYFSANQYDSSAQCYQRAIALDDENPQYYKNIALVYKKLNMTEMVVRSYENAARVLHPDVTAYVYNDLAAYCMEKLLWRKAIDAFQRALELNPEMVTPYYFLGMCYMQIPENQTAARMFETFLKKTADDPEKKGERYSAQKMVEYLKGLKKSK
ncbi:MAG: tetratricopeptide repeat protein, partial [Bacteroidota bacterium]